MRRLPPRIKGLGFILWHARHEFYHILLGLLWAWFLREWWHEFNLRWIWLSLFASLLPDVDHFFYFFTYGRKEMYAQQAKQLLKRKQWRELSMFMEQGHKYNTNLATHNLYVMLLLLALAGMSSFIEWRVGVILFGAMIVHYVFDIFDDIFQLGYLNPNWKRWGRVRHW